MELFLTIHFGEHLGIPLDLGRLWWEHLDLLWLFPGIHGQAQLNSYVCAKMSPSTGDKVLLPAAELSSIPQLVKGLSILPFLIGTYCFPLPSHAALCPERECAKTPPPLEEDPCSCLCTLTSASTAEFEIAILKTQWFFCSHTSEMQPLSSHGDRGIAAFCISQKQGVPYWATLLESKDMYMFTFRLCV